MGTRIVHCLILIQLGFFLYSGSSVREKQLNQKKEKQLPSSASISTTQADITTPLPTVPTTNIPATTTPTVTTPVFNPAVSNPADSTAASTSPSGGSSSWCVASQSASQTALQVALDYACGYGGADCSAIQPSGSCYNPNTIRDHASCAFNTYYRKNPLPNSCNFGGTALITSTDPSNGTCQYPSTSTSSSVLNTTNSSGSTVFGAGPSNPTGSASTMPSQPGLFISTCLMMMVLTRNLL